MRISVSVLGMAKKPLSSGSVGPAALSGRDAADEGSATESRGGRIACPVPGTLALAAWLSVAAGAIAVGATATTSGGDVDGRPSARSSASRRCSIACRVWRTARMSWRNASAESCA